MNFKSQNGIVMVEIIVTILIITIGVSGIGLLILRAVQATQDLSQRSQSIWIVEDYVGRMRSNPEGAKAGAYELDPLDIDCTEPPANMCAETYQDGAEVPAANCTPGTPNTMAIFDNWITVCGISSTIYDSPSDFVLNPRLTSTCTIRLDRSSNESGTNDCIQYLVNLTWDTKITQGATLEEDRVNQNDYSMVVRFH